MHKLPSILIMCWDYLNILFWQRQPITPSTVHILLHILVLLLLLKLQQLLLAAWRWSPCPPSSPSCPPPTTWLCWAWCLHRWWQDCWWLMITRSSWLNCALRDDKAVFWVSIGHNEAVAVGNWWYWISKGHLCLYILHKVETWSGVTDAWLTHSLTTLLCSAPYKV